MESKKTRYYHASKTRFRPGEIVDPNNPNVSPNFYSSNTGLFYMTTAPEPHYTVADRALRENWEVYEVLPLNKKQISYGNSWNELTCTGPVKILRNVGNVRALAKIGKNKKKLSEEEKEWKKNRIQEAEEALADPEKMKEWKEWSRQSPEKAIEETKADWKFHDPQVSTVYEKNRWGPSALPPKNLNINEQELENALKEFKQKVKLQRKRERKKKNVVQDGSN